MTDQVCRVRSYLDSFSPHLFHFMHLSLAIALTLVDLLLGLTLTCEFEPRTYEFEEHYPHSFLGFEFVGVSYFLTFGIALHKLPNGILMESMST